MKSKLALLGIVMIMMISIVVATPICVDLISGTPTTRTGFTSGIVGAQGGNNTNLNVSGIIQTKVWQGFYGEVEGNITLRDNSGDQMYSWNAGLNGTVLASRSSVINWNNITVVNDCTTDEILTGTMSDRVNTTFIQNNNTGFNIGTVIINAGSTCAMHTYVNDNSQNNVFEEIIVSDGINNVYATNVYVDTVGFDGNSHDYQLIVPETGNSSTTTYYLYMELK